MLAGLCNPWVELVDHCESQTAHLLNLLFVWQSWELSFGLSCCFYWNQEVVMVLVVLLLVVPKACCFLLIFPVAMGH